METKRLELIKSNGYLRRKAAWHPRADHHGYVAEHVLVAESALGHLLPDGAVVHHHDENKANNAPCNLAICEDRKYHRLVHKRLRVLRAGGDPETQRFCQCCSTLKLRADFHLNAYEYDGLAASCKSCASEKHAAWFQRVGKERRNVRRRQHAVAICALKVREEV